jgi:hypothetical protein
MTLCICMSQQHVNNSRHRDCQGSAEPCPPPALTGDSRLVLFHYDLGLLLFLPLPAGVTGMSSMSNSGT